MARFDASSASCERRSASAVLRAVTSRSTTVVSTPRWVCSCDSDASTGNGLPSRRRPVSSRSEPGASTIAEPRAPGTRATLSTNRSIGLPSAAAASMPNMVSAARLNSTMPRSSSTVTTPSVTAWISRSMRRSAEACRRTLRRTKPRPEIVSSTAITALTASSSDCVVREASPSWAENALVNCVSRAFRTGAWRRISCTAGACVSPARMCSRARSTSVIMSWIVRSPSVQVAIGRDMNGTCWNRRNMRTSPSMSSGWLPP